MNPLDMSQMMGLMYPNGQPAGAPPRPRAQAQQQLQGMEEMEPVNPDLSIPFSPSQRYIDEGSKQEESLNGYDVDSIAAAHKRAVDRGVLSPELAKYLLPMSMVEGRGADMGVKTGKKTDIDPSVGFYASQRFKHSLSEMGMEEGVDYFTYRAVDKLDKMRKMQTYIQPIGGSPAMAAVILGEKAQLKIAGGTLEGAIKAYNGNGTAIEYIDGKPIPADAKRYLAKVLEAEKLLAHPDNERLSRTYRQASAKLQRESEK